jgi:hypothetical protein
MYQRNAEWQARDRSGESHTVTTDRTTMHPVPAAARDDEHVDIDYAATPMSSDSANRSGRAPGADGRFVTR